MEPVIYTRRAPEHAEELAVARRHLLVRELRTQLPRGSLVVPRYSALPYYEELEADCTVLGCRLINSHAQHQYVADLMRWAADLEGMTPRSWREWGGLPEGRYVMKGVTNSRKFDWAGRMFVPSISEIPRVAGRLLDDPLIADQGLVVREYIPLRKLGEGLNGMPISHEWRFFLLYGELLAAGYYWAQEPDTCPGDPSKPPAAAVAVARRAWARLSIKVPFLVIDVAERADGGWLVIELNDGQQSGLSIIEPGPFYARLAERLRSRTQLIPRRLPPREPYEGEDGA